MAGRPESSSGSGTVSEVAAVIVGCLAAFFLLRIAFYLGKLAAYREMLRGLIRRTRC
jgi:hypothetical protein